MRTMFSKSIVAAVLLACVASAGAQRAGDDRSQPQAQKPAQSSAQQQPAVDPQAIAALRRMGGFLRDQQSFTIHASTDTDYVVGNDQTVRHTSQGDVKVRRPDHLRADVVSDRKARQFFYDGKTFTMYGPRVNYYTQIPAPPTIAQLADELRDKYGLELPLVDLFRWGSDSADFSDITSARYVGHATIDGVETDQYAFRQPGLDWQIWIERGDRPLPRKLLLTTTDDPARPQHEIRMSWDLGAKHPDSEFAFVPPQGSHEIAIQDVEQRRAAAARQERQARRGVRNK